MVCLLSPVISNRQFIPHRPRLSSHGFEYSDPLYWAIPTLAPVVLVRHRRHSQVQMRVSRSDSVLELEHRSSPHVIRVFTSAHYSQTHLAFTNRRSGRTQIPKVDSAAGEIQTLTTAFPMEALASSNSRIRRLISYAATSHSELSISRSWCSTIPH